MLEHVTTNPTLWITAANLLYLAAYSVHDILWLRILAVVAASLLIPYYAMQPVPLHAAIEWNVVFIAINGLWIVKLMFRRREPSERSIRSRQALMSRHAM